MGGLGPHRVSHCRSPALCCIFILQSEKRASRWGGAGGARVELVCAVYACVFQSMGEGEVGAGGGYTVVLFPSALILLSWAEGRGGVCK